ncbi:hypothetical protein ACLOJK_000097 [Asimina triloba]
MAAHDSLFQKVNDQRSMGHHFSASLELKAGLVFDYYQGKDYYQSKTNLSSWNPENRNCSTWEGIRCDNATGHVTSLHLSQLKISATPNASLTKLVVLNLSRNGYYDDLSNLIPLKLESTRALIQNMSSSRELNLNDIDVSEEGSECGQAMSSALPNSVG